MAKRKGVVQTIENPNFMDITKSEPVKKTISKTLPESKQKKTIPIQEGANSKKTIPIIRERGKQKKTMPTSLFLEESATQTVQQTASPSQRKLTPVSEMMTHEEVAIVEPKSTRRTVENLPFGYHLKQVVTVDDEPYILKVLNQYGQLFLAFVDCPFRNSSPSKLYSIDFEQYVDVTYARGVLECLEMNVSGIAMLYGNSSNFEIVGRYDDINIVSLISEAGSGDTVSQSLYPVVMLSEVMEHPSEIVAIVDDAQKQLFKIVTSQDASTMNSIKSLLSGLSAKYEQYNETYDSIFNEILESVNKLKSTDRLTDNVSLSIRRRYEILEHIIHQNRFIAQELTNLRGVDELLSTSANILNSQVRKSMTKTY
jgi:hypothetical protein